MCEICASPRRNPLRPRLIHESARANALDLLEDRSGARMPIEPRVLSAAPAEVLLKDAMENRLVPARELEGRGQHDVATMVEDRVVVSELYVFGSDCLSLAFLR